MYVDLTTMLLVIFSLIEIKCQPDGGSDLMPGSVPVQFFLPEQKCQYLSRLMESVYIVHLSSNCSVEEEEKLNWN